MYFIYNWRYWQNLAQSLDNIGIDSYVNIEGERTMFGIQHVQYVEGDSSPETTSQWDRIPKFMLRNVTRSFANSASTTNTIEMHWYFGMKLIELRTVYIKKLGGWQDWARGSPYSIRCLRPFQYTYIHGWRILPTKIVWTNKSKKWSQHVGLYR